MAPSLARYDVANVCLGNTELACNGRFTHASGGQSANLDNIGLRELAIWIGLSLYRTIASFAVAIPHVLGLSASKQVVWVNAGWVIALMANIQIFRNWPEMQLVGNTMGKKGAAVMTDCATAAPGKRTSPQPAFILAAIVYPSPEFLCKGLARRNRATMSAQVQIRLTFDGSVAGLGLFGDCGFLSTAAMTIAVRNIVRGIMGLHKNLHFLCQVPGRLQRRWDNFIGCCYSCILAHLGECRNV